MKTIRISILCVLAAVVVSGCATRQQQASDSSRIRTAYTASVQPQEIPAIDASPDIFVDGGTP